MSAFKQLILPSVVWWHCTQKSSSVGGGDSWDRCGASEAAGIWHDTLDAAL